MSPVNLPLMEKENSLFLEPELVAPNVGRVHSVNNVKIYKK